MTKTEWQKIAVQIGNDVYMTVNTPETIGGDNETGYILMFFNAKKHNGQSTLVSSALNSDDVKRLLNNVLRHIDGPKAKIVSSDGTDIN